MRLHLVSSKLFAKTLPIMPVCLSINPEIFIEKLDWGKIYGTRRKPTHKKSEPRPDERADIIILLTFKFHVYTDWTDNEKILLHIVRISIHKKYFRL